MTSQGENNLQNSDFKVVQYGHKMRKNYLWGIKESPPNHFEYLCQNGFNRFYYHNKKEN